MPLVFLALALGSQTTPPCILSDAQREHLLSYLPASLQLDDWLLHYSTEQHGCSLRQACAQRLLGLHEPPRPAPFPAVLCEYYLSSPLNFSHPISHTHSPPNSPPYLLLSPPPPSVQNETTDPPFVSSPVSLCPRPPIAATSPQTCGSKARALRCWSCSTATAPSSARLLPSHGIFRHTTSAQASWLESTVEGTSCRGVANVWACLFRRVLLVYNATLNQRLQVILCY